MATFSERSHYRPASIVLIFASCLSLAAVFVGVPGWICFLVAAPLLILLTVITYHRLRDGALSGGWVWLMILQFGIGPTWHLSDYLTVNLGGIVIWCVPVILAWFVPANCGAHPKTESV